MSSFSRSLANILFGWVSGVISKIWAMISTDSGTALIPWIGKKWILIVAALCLLGLAIDLIVYAFRWRPHKVWISAYNRLKNELHKDPAITNNGNRKKGVTYESLAADTVIASESMPVSDSGVVTNQNLMEDKTIRFQPERIQNKQVTSDEALSPSEYERRYARPEKERHTKKEIGQYSPQTIDYVAPRRKHIPLSDMTGDDENFVSEPKRRRRSSTRIDPEEAYNAPIYPPQWNIKANTGENMDNE